MVSDEKLGRSAFVSAKASVRRVVAEALLPGCLLAVYVWYLTRTGITGRVLYEAADSAGDMLQVSRALERRWYLTGHHSDVGVHHPGPFGLWFKTVASTLHRAGFGGSVYAVAMSVFLGLRLAALALASAAFARLTGSRLAGWCAALGLAVVLAYEGDVTGLDLNGSGIHFLSPWAVLLLLTGALLLVTGRGGPNLLLLGSGVAAHVHTPSFPLGVTGLVFAAAALCAKSVPRRARRSGFALLAVFSVPLLVRMFAEPGFPFSYVAAASRRRDLASSPTGRTALEGLVGIVDVPRVVLLCALAFPCVLAAFTWRRNRPASLALAAGTFWSVVVVTVSPSQDRVATELVWIAGVVLFFFAVVGAGVVLLAGRLLDRLLPDEGAWRPVRIGLAAVVASLLLVAVLGVTNAALPPELSTGGGADGRHVPVLVDAMLEEAGGRPFALVLAEPNWFSTSSGVLLELERRGERFCVAANGAYEQALATFLSENRRCNPDGTSLPTFAVTWDAEAGPWFPGGTRPGDAGTAALPPDATDRLCWSGPSGAECPARLPDGSSFVAAVYDPGPGAYGIVHPLRLLLFRCTPHRDLGCGEFAEPSRTAAP